MLIKYITQGCDQECKKQGERQANISPKLQMNMTQMFLMKKKEKQHE